MTAPTLHDSVAMRTRTKRAVREFKPVLWMDATRVPANVVVNGGFETTGAGAPGTATVFGTWDASVADTGSSIIVNTTAQDSGTNCCELAIGAAGKLCYVRQLTLLTVGTTYTLRFRAKHSVTGESRTIAIAHTGGDIQIALTDAYVTYTTTFTATDTYLMFKRADVSAHSLYLDNVTCWKTSETPVNAATIPAWTSRDKSHVEFANTSIATHPTYTAATKAVTFAGTDDCLSKATATLTGTSGRVMITCATTAESTAQVLYSQSDTAGAADYLWLGITAANKMWYKFDKGAADAVELTGNTVLGTGTHVLEWASDGSTITMSVDGSLQTVDLVVGSGANAGDWFGDIDGANNSTIGASVDNTGTPESPFVGTIQEIVALEPDESTGNATRLRRTLAKLGSVTLASGIGLLLADGAGILLSDNSGLILG